MKPYAFEIRDEKRLRVLIDTDAACEADDPYAVAHALMTPRFDVRAVLAEQYRSSGEDSEAASYLAVEKLVGLMGLGGRVAVCHGASTPLADERTPVDCEAARAIIAEALRDDEHPLFIFCQGALTNLASALLLEPAIAPRLTCIWIGGGMYPEGGEEFNLGNDVAAANVVFASSMALWQVPMDCYTSVRVSYAELQTKVAPCGALGRYLFDNMMRYAATPGAGWIAGESWSLGDSPVVALALHPPMTGYEVIEAPRVRKDCTYERGTGYRSIRVYHQVDVRFLLEDFFAKLALWTANRT